MENQPPPPDDPSAPDAPIVALLRLRNDALVTTLSTEELTRRLSELRTLAQQPVSLTARVKSESNKVATRVGGRVSAAAKLQKSLDEI